MANRKSEGGFRYLLETISDWIWEIDAEGTYTYSSPTVTKLLGYAVSEIIGKKPFDLMPPAEAERIAAIFNQYRKKRQPFVGLQNWNIHKNGKKVLLETSGVPYYDSKGRFDGFCGIDRDIGERKIALEELNLSEQRYRAIIESIPLGMHMYRLSGKNKLTFIGANPSADTILGVENGQFIGKRIEEAFPALKNTEIPQIYKKVAREGFLWRTDQVEYHENKISGAFEVTAFQTSPGYMVAAFRDITQKKQAEAALKESERKYRDLFENIRDIYFEATINGKILEISPSVEAISKFSRKDLIGRSIEILFLDAMQKKTLLRELLKKGELPDYEVTLKDKDGSPHAYSLHVAILNYKNKKLHKKIIGSFRDRTESKFLQEQLHQAQKMEAVGRLAGGIAHDFNNLLTVIQGYTELTLGLLNQNDPIYANIKEIGSAVSRAEALTRQLLTFSRKQVVQPEVLSLSTIISNMQKMLGRLIGEDIKLQLKLDQKSGFIKADPGQIEQIIMNLVVNARDAMPNGGTLEIETSNEIVNEEVDLPSIQKMKAGSYVLLVVRDTGIGMDKNIMEHIFEPFFTTKDISKGTGMGLSTIYGIVKQSDGFIWAYSEPGNGTRFKIYLPRVDEIRSRQRIVEYKEDELIGNETILVVEDELNLRQLVVKSLNKYGYKTIEAAHGGSALLICEKKETPIDLMVCDVIMPEMKGPELVQRLKKLQPKMKVLFMSGYTDSSINLQKLLAKKYQYIQKPFATKVLLQKIRDVLSSSS